jgi:hypothetical protein
MEPVKEVSDTFSIHIFLKKKKTIYFLGNTDNKTKKSVEISRLKLISCFKKTKV